MKTIVRSCRDTLRAWFDSDTARENGKAGKTDKIGKAESEFQLLRRPPQRSALNRRHRANRKDKLPHTPGLECAV